MEWLARIHCTGRIIVCFKSILKIYLKIYWIFTEAVAIKFYLYIDFSHGNCFYTGLTSRFPFSGCFCICVVTSYIKCYVMLCYAMLHSHVKEGVQKGALFFVVASFKSLQLWLQVCNKIIVSGSQKSLSKNLYPLYDCRCHRFCFLFLMYVTQCLKFEEHCSWVGLLVNKR